MGWKECEKKWLYAKNINFWVRGVIKLIEFFLKRMKKIGGNYFKRSWRGVSFQTFRNVKHRCDSGPRKNELF